MTSPLNILIAGASGYIGQAIIPDLLKKFPDCTITALSRSAQSSDDPRVVWRTCDLFSLKSLENAAPDKVDIAFYLVHSMGPTAQLDQGSFADYDVILADNFARTLRNKNISQLIYLGGLVPASKHLSLHLQSRLEVEEVFAEAKLPTTTFRAGLIIGEAGSSFQILTKLVDRLPVMLCPKWTQTMTTPVDLKTVTSALITASAEPKYVGQIYDLAGCEPLSYVEMMRATANYMKKKRAFIAVPFFTPTLSRLWVTLITGTSKGLVYPLVASLEHAMVARPDHLFSRSSPSKTYGKLLEEIGLSTESKKRVHVYQAQRKTVRSVQRLVLPRGRDAEWIKDQYLSWLPKFLAPLIRVGVVSNKIHFSLIFSRIVMLELTLNEERSNKDRQLLYITGGLLADRSAGTSSGRLEFRTVLHRRFVLAAIHDFKPSLSWYVYKYTQAVLHSLVMTAFGRYLKKRRAAESKNDSSR